MATLRDRLQDLADNGPKWVTDEHTYLVGISFQTNHHLTMVQARCIGLVGLLDHLLMLAISMWHRSNFDCLVLESPYSETNTHFQERFLTPVSRELALLGGYSDLGRGSMVHSVWLL